MKLGILVKTLVVAIAMFAATSCLAKPAVDNTGPLAIELEEGNFVALIGEVSDATVSDVIEKVSQSKAKHLNLFISSPGGSIVAGAQLISALHGSGKTFTCISDFDASMAFVIFQSAPCEQRVVTSSTIQMQHQASYSLSGQDSRNRSMLSFIQHMILAQDEFQAKRLGISIEAFRARVHDDYWQWGLDSLTEHTADREGLIKCDGGLTKKHDTVTVDTMFGSVKVEVNKCPLITKVYGVAKDKRILVLSPAEMEKIDNQIQKFLDSRDPRNLMKEGKLEQYFNAMAP